MASGLRRIAEAPVELGRSRKGFERIGQALNRSASSPPDAQGTPADCGLVLAKFAPAELRQIRRPLGSAARHGGGLGRVSDERAGMIK